MKWRGLWIGLVVIIGLVITAIALLAGSQAMLAQPPAPKPQLPPIAEPPRPTPATIQLTPHPTAAKPSDSLSAAAASVNELGLHEGSIYFNSPTEMTQGQEQELLAVITIQELTND